MARTTGRLRRLRSGGARRARQVEAGEKVALIIADQWMPRCRPRGPRGRTNPADRPEGASRIWGDQSAAPRSSRLRVRTARKLHSQALVPAGHLYRDRGSWPRDPGARPAHGARAHRRGPVARTNEVRSSRSERIPYGFTRRAPRGAGGAWRRRRGDSAFRRHPPRRPRPENPTNKEISDAWRHEPSAARLRPRHRRRRPAGSRPRCHTSEGLETVVIERDSVGAAGTARDPQLLGFRGHQRQRAARAPTSRHGSSTVCLRAKGAAGRKRHFTLRTDRDHRPRGHHRDRGSTALSRCPRGARRRAGPYATRARGSCAGQHLFVAGGNAAGQAVLYFEYAAGHALVRGARGGCQNTCPADRPPRTSRCACERRCRLGRGPRELTLEGTAAETEKGSRRAS
jgi:hypothetical protein